MRVRNLNQTHHIEAEYGCQIELFHIWLIDFTGPLPLTSTGKKYLIVAVEHMTRWPVARASPSADSGVAVTFARLGKPYRASFIAILDCDYLNLFR